MAYKIERNDQYITRLADFVLKEYGIPVSAITPANRGFYAETWKIVTYLNAYLDRFLDTGEMDGIEDYMSGWIEESFMFADKII